MEYLVENGFIKSNKESIIEKLRKKIHIKKHTAHKLVKDGKVIEGKGITIKLT